jgi:hypothetical protein
MRAQGWWYAALGIAGFAVTSAAWAQVGSIERLVMPGPVASAHADVESTCSSCHVPFSRGKQSGLCLACHDDVARDIAASSGFHGKSSNVENGECVTCHTEHKGRNADILGLDAARFDHESTNFPLRGKHAETMCADCHVTGKPYHAAETECNACHADDDRHKGNLGTACADCHAVTAWKDVRFDHADVTDFALTGKHATTTCAACHVDEHYKDTVRTCNGCHADDDRHMGKNGTECAQCHTTRDWKELLFDHFERTGFALRGGHDDLACDACHAGGNVEVKVPNTCVGCHREDDVHMGNNGAKCASCHRVTEWPDVTFSHERDTNFALKGAHGDLKCESCHVQPAETVELPTQCFGCHEDDPHEGQLGEACASCHSEIVWKGDVRFDHDLARFPLLGKHGAVECDACHATQAFHDAPQACIECHREDDAHDGRLGTACATCHNPNDWLAWTFDHDVQTDFALTGAHEGLNCHACHRTPVDGTIVLSTTCGSCHRGDDVHRGEFGSDCAQCHTTESFRDLRELQ